MASANIAYVFIGGAALAAVVATFGVVKLVESYQTPADAVEKDVKTTNVVMARRTLYQGVEIASDDLWVRSIPTEYLPEVVADAKTSEKSKAEVFKSRERVVGQVPAERILKNEIIRPERLADSGAGTGLNAVIARGMRALSLDLRNGDAITSFLQPGNYVDVLVTMEDEIGGLHTETLMQSVFIVGVNSKAENESEEDKASRGKQRPSVTFMVTPEQAEQLAYATEMGDVSLALRNVQDLTFDPTTQFDIDGVLRRISAQKEADPAARMVRVPTGPVGSPRPAPVAADPVPVEPVRSNAPQIDIIRGNQHTSVPAEEKVNLPGGEGAANNAERRQKK